MHAPLSPETLLTLLEKEIVSKSQSKNLFVVGISGLDASGKSQVASGLKQKLEDYGKNALLISGDSFQYSREYKENLQEESWSLQHIHQTINFEK